MTREELRDYIFNFWNDWGAFNYDDEIKYEIYTNLKSEKGIEKELSFIENEFEAGWDENSLEYKRLHELKNKINNYLRKGDFKNDILYSTSTISRRSNYIVFE